MKLKKRPKKILMALLILILIVAIVFVGSKIFFGRSEVTEVRVLKTINKYGYTLKDNKTKKYQQMFKELEKLLTKDSVDEEEYVKKITEMFIYDFYSLNDKSTKTDVGGTDFVYPNILEDFLEKAEDTYYKYVENNMYNDRKQKLTTVDEITIDSVEQIEFAYGEETDEEAYEVNASWTYTDDDFNDYQKKATLIFVHDDIKLSLVELK